MGWFTWVDISSLLGLWDLLVFWFGDWCFEGWDDWHVLDSLDFVFWWGRRDMDFRTLTWVRGLCWCCGYVLEC